jgi:glutathione S-transferase
MHPVNTKQYSLMMLFDFDCTVTRHQVTNGLFPVLAKCIKNLDRSADGEMLSAIMSELTAVDAQLQKSGGPYLCGKELTVVDCSYAPKLYHAKTTLAQVRRAVCHTTTVANNTAASTKTVARSRTLRATLLLLLLLLVLLLVLRLLLIVGCSGLLVQQPLRSLLALPV